MNEYFQPASVPAPNSPGSSAVIRAEFSSIAAAFDKMPVMAGSANEFVVVNPSGTALIAAGFGIADVVSEAGTQTLTNKTINWSDNSISTTPIAGGGTGATDLSGAQAALGINLKADANNAVLTGAPTAPTPPSGNSSARLATTQFVQDAVAIAGGVTPSNASPLINGPATPGVSGQVSRDDHVHPVDTSRAPASASTASGTSFAPDAGISATNVQAAIVELVSDVSAAISGLAPLSSPAFTGNPTAPTPATSDNDTSVATTAFVQSLLAQQPAGMGPSDNTPLMNGTAGPGTSVDASRSDHVHPVDTSRAPASAGTAAGTSFTPVGGVAATDVQAAIAELDSEKALASAGTAVGTSFTPAGGIAATSVQAAIVELDSEKAPASAGTAAGTSFTPAGNVAATNVQAAIAELDSEKLQASLNLSDVADPAAARANLGIVTSGITRGTAVSPTSGTAVDFTGIPSGVNRITVMLTGLSTNGYQTMFLQLGTSGGVVTSGYVSDSSTNSLAYQHTDGFAAQIGTDYSTLTQGVFTLTRQSGNTWCCTGVFGTQGATYNTDTSGYLALGAALDRVRIRTSGGETFDSGTINIFYE